MAADFDLAIVGSGFGGSLLALVARRLGKSVILIEKGEHPRFAIGESSTPLANLLLEELARRYELPRLLPLTKWGLWQKEYPHVGCGLKRGFSFFHHQRGQPWISMPQRRNELLVAASPHNAIGDTHWFRADVDQFLVKEAVTERVEYVDLVHITSAEFAGDFVKLTGSRKGSPFVARARLIIDASGPNGFLQKALDLPESSFPTMPSTQGLFTHFSDVRPFSSIHGQPEDTPYPIDAAAVHHVFDGGWIWVLRFNNGITSAGVAASASLANELNFSAGAKGWERLLAMFPSVQQQFASACPVQPFIHAPRLSFRTTQAAGLHWAMLPHTAGFVDPLLSTGFPLNLLGIGRLAQSLEGGKEWAPEEAFRSYGNRTLEELDFTALLVSALYACMDDFEIFTALSLLYFAAASYSEVMRRLGEPVHVFLLCDDPRFAPSVRRIVKLALHKPRPSASRSDLLSQIKTVIEPFDLAGFNDAARRNWYPVLASDLLLASSKTGATPDSVKKMLERSGF